MARLRIIKEPDPILREKSQEITEINSEIKRLISDMAYTMKKDNGIGLAAPQVGKNIRLILISAENGPLAMINPQITQKSLAKEIEEEGCLSCPGKAVLVKRHKSVKIQCLNDRGEKIKFKATGLFARVIQHEVDHLDGILIVDKK